MNNFIEWCDKKGGSWFGFICWCERLKIRWKLFWDYWRFHHINKFQEKWRKTYDYPPSKDGYK